MGILIRNTIRFKGRRDYTNTFELDIIIISIKERGDDNLNNFNNKEDKKKIKVIKIDKYYSEREKLEL